MVLALLLGVVEVMVFAQVVFGIRDYRRRCDGSPRRTWGPRPFYHSPTPRHWRSH